MKKTIILLLFLLVVGVMSGYMLQNHSDMQVQLPQTFETEEIKEEEAVPLEVTFSKNGSFYSENIDVELSCNYKDAVIYYTTDGNDPTTNSKKYTDPIAVTAKSAVNALTIKAIAVSEEETSGIFCKSYVTGKNIFERFDPTTLVFVLSTDEYNLYDYYYGVAVEGYIREEYLNSDDYNGGPLEQNAPANWYMSGRESERNMYVEVFDSAGNQLISQAAGGRVVGGYSRAVDQKSWRLIARNSYSEGNGKFKYAFFPGAVDAYGNMLTRFDRITLRNNANDREFAAVRDELSMTLSAQAGFPDFQNVRPAAVFLNSKYYGFAWLHEAYSNDYLELQYGGNKDNFRIVGSKEKEVEGDDEQCVNDWSHVLEVAGSDLRYDKNFKEFCELVDIDNFMLYYAIQIYIDNKDWPGNNYKAWRYYPSEGEEITSAYLDGKWRFLLFDAEFAWGLYGKGYRDDTLSDVLTGHHMQGSSDLLNAVLKRSDMQEKFANTICDLIGGSFKTENVLEVLEKLIAESDTECMYALNNGYTSVWANEWTFADSRQQIREFAQKRPNVMLKSLQKQFIYEDKFYTVTLNNPSGAITSLNSQTAKSAGTLSARYFSVCSVPISAGAYAGYEFDHWDINGKEYNENEMMLDASMADSDGHIAVTLYMKKKPAQESIYVSEVYTAGAGDWIELYNPSENAVTLSGYYLSDDEENMKKWLIPTTEIPTGSTFTIACKNNDQISALKKYRTNFSLKTGETLYFTNSDGEILSKAVIVEMNEDQSLNRGIDGAYHIGTVSENIHIEE